MRGIRILFIVVSLFISKFSFGQTKIFGIVGDSTRKVAFANIILKTKNENLVAAYAVSDKQGNYILFVQNNGDFNLEFSFLGYETSRVAIKIDGQKEVNININLKEKPFELDEVIVQTDPISITEDTITFITKYFVKGNEQTVEDLLKRIPGVEVDSEGNIKIGNREIEKLMIEGDDLFEKGYKILSKNMPAYPIESVEILKNYSNNRLLKGIEDSDKVALNLKLDEKSKRIWFGNAEVSGGNNHFYQAKGNLMNFGKKNKYYFLTHLNNIGYDATGDMENLIRPFRIDEPASIGDNQSVNPILYLSPYQLNFKQNRTNFNNTKLASFSAILNPTKKLKIRTLTFLNWDETMFFRNSTYVVDVNTTNFSNTEDHILRNNKNLAFGKLDLSYNISKNTILEATTKYNNGNFSDASNLIFNSDSTTENLQHKNTLFDQKINYTHQIDNKNVLLLTGRFIDEKIPQHYRLNKFFYQDLFPQNTEVDNVLQSTKNQMQFVGINANLLSRKDNGRLLEIELGNEFRNDKLSSTFSLLEGNAVTERPSGFQNQEGYQVNDLYLNGEYRFRIKGIDIVPKLEFHQLFNKLKNNTNLKNQNPFFVNPTIGIDWKVNDKNKITSSYSYNKTNAKILDIYRDFVLTDFRSFNRGTGNFNQLSASNFTFTHQLGNWAGRFFSNTSIIYNNNHNFFSTNTQLTQNYTQADKILISGRELINILSNLNYYFKFISSNLKLDVGYAKIDFKNTVNDSELRRVRNKNYYYGLELRSGFKGIFNYHIGTNWITTNVETTTNITFTNAISFLDISFIFNNKFDIQFQSERYYFGSLQNNNTYYFLDFDARYKLTENKITLGIVGKNLFNTENFMSFSASDIGTSTTTYRLLPRCILLKVEYRF